MKRITDIPNVTKDMQAVYEKFMDSGGNFKDLLPHIDAFLEKYPYYVEALVLKARAFMALGRNADALKCLKMAKRADRWNLTGRFDEAEIFLGRNKKDESIAAYVAAVKAYATELKSGIESYLLSYDQESGDRIHAHTLLTLTDFFAHDEENRPFETLRDELEKLKDKLKHMNPYNLDGKV